jgi:hypothetical protein
MLDQIARLKSQPAAVLRKKATPPLRASIGRLIKALRLASRRNARSAVALAAASEDQQHDPRIAIFRRAGAHLNDCTSNLRRQVGRAIPAAIKAAYPKGNCTQGHELQDRRRS